MHTLTIEPLPYWMAHLPAGIVYGRCSCGWTCTHVKESGVHDMHRRHVRLHSDIGRCSFCDGPTPCLKD